ncbi:MAG: adenylosuccinate lyase [Tenericutes bacterium HGW-Tenericutes-6]|nr:MAG: adenylosuccinate lyase [Tenericutes bacterium HGW-Tenericutes-6]
MISRYQHENFKYLWSDQNKFNQFLKVEIANAYAWMKHGLVSESDYKKLEKTTFKLEDIEKLELKTKHDVIAFTKACALSLGDEKKYFHYGLTSTDVVDTAQSLILKEVNDILIDDIDQFMEVLRYHAQTYKMTPIMGRTHGIHAEITSFGLKFALWYDDFKRLKAQFLDAAKNMEVIKLSGAVGTFSQSDPEIQKIVSRKLNLIETNIATQVLQRDRHANYLSSIALLGAELEKIAVEIRHLSRTEVFEVSEYFDQNQKGSSAMPHKRNPVSSENITGLSRVLRGYMVTAYENIALWHERDISHSSAERIILADATSLIDYMLKRYKETLKNLVVYPNHMLRNINLTQGVIFAQGILHKLIDQGLSREDAYDLVQKLSFEALNRETPFKDLLLKNDTILSYLKPDDINHQFDITHYLKHVNHIYKEVFG